MKNTVRNENGPQGHKPGPVRVCTHNTGRPNLPPATVKYLKQTWMRPFQSFHCLSAKRPSGKHATMCAAHCPGKQGTPSLPGTA